MSDIPDNHKFIKPRTPKTAWKPGQSGNPKGRPKKGDCIIEIARNLLQKKAELLDGTKFDMTWEELLARTWLEQSLKDPTLRKELHDRIYGRVPLPIQGQMSGEIMLKVVYETEVKQPDGNSTG